MKIVNSIKHVVDRDLCCGCGICCVTCRQEAISNVFDQKRGVWRPIINEGLCTHCGACLDVCPFGARDKESDVSEYRQYAFGKEGNTHKDLGCYRATYVGHGITDYRDMGSSGGIASALMASHLEASDGRAIGVRQVRTNEHPLFETESTEDPRNVAALAGTKYYPVEFSRVIGTAPLDRPLLVVCLPCVAYALHRFKRRNPEYREHMTVIGLTCGHCPSALFSDFLLSRKERGHSRINFRNHDATLAPYSRYSMDVHAEQSSGRRQHSLPFWGSLYGFSFVNWMFAMNACRFCDDTFAAFADISLMDAWDPRYTADTRGTSFVICRTSKGESLLTMATQKKHVSLSEIDADSIARSQRGVLHNKKVRLATLLRLSKCNVPSLVAKETSLQAALASLPWLFKAWRAVRVCPALYSLGARSFAVPILAGIDWRGLLRLFLRGRRNKQKSRA